MKNKYSHKAKAFLRISALVLIAVLMLSALSSCKARSLAPSDDALATVGTITYGNSDGTKTVFEVPYEELYFYAATFDDVVGDEHEKGSAEYNKALWELIEKYVTTNYAILALCADMGVTYDEKELRDEVKAEVEDIINESFGGSRSDYLASLSEQGMTDHYMRFFLGTEILYSKLPMIYSQKGLVPTTESKIKEYIEENFICTKHIVIFNDTGDDKEQNLSNAEAARELLVNGTSINDLIGGKILNINEDLLIPYDGYYFPKGTMEEDYEAAAFALEIGEVSEVITSMAENNMGEYVECYYVIQRMPLSATYIDKHLTDLGDEIASSIIANKYDQLASALVFVPNEYALSLDLSALPALSAGTDVTAITVASITAGVVVIVAVVVILLAQNHKKKLARARALREKNDK